MFWAKLLNFWILAFMVFYANPMNDPLKPWSEMNSYHPVNVKVREMLEKELEKDEDDRVVTVEWPDIAPYVAASWVSAVCLILDYFLRAWDSSAPLPAIKAANTQCNCLPHTVNPWREKKMIRGYDRT